MLVEALLESVGRVCVCTMSGGQTNFPTQFWKKSRGESF